jgi:hypothetical protein
VAKLRASDAEIAAARSALFPKVSLSANIQGNIGQLNVNNSPYFPVAKPQGVDDDRTPLSRRLIQALDADEAISVAIRAPALDVAQQELIDRRVFGILESRATPSARS